MRTLRLVRSALVLMSMTLAAACDKPATQAADDAAASSRASATGDPPAAPAASSAAGTNDADAGVPSKPTGKTVETPAGLATESGDEIRLAGKTIYPPPDCPAGGKDGCAKVKAVRAGMEGVKILRHFDGPGGPKSILLLQATTAGNACNGGPLFFVRVAKDAPPQYSDVFDYCGGPDPMVGAMPDKILINVPAHPPNKGGAIIPAKNMEYDIATGTLVAAAPEKKRKR
ncbi:MAG: hypothetical protein JWO86_4159 [Myxococcaceae bacterium]|nr:hypothetical protein [Myxococcaceae bacterium]